MTNKILNQLFSSCKKWKTLVLIGMLLTLGVGQTWAASTVNGGYIYFDEYNSGYTGAGDMQFWIGHNSYSCAYSMSKISNTKLWYYSASGWNDATYFAFTSGCNNWGCANQKYYDRIGSNTWKSATKESYTLNSGSYYVFKVASTANKAAVNSDSPYGYQGNAATSLNKTITVKAKVSTNGGSSYSEATSPGTLSASSKKFTAYNSCASATSLSSGTISCGYTATTTLTAADATGYDFVGWYNSSGTRQTTSKTLTIYPTANATYYAYYKAKTTTITLDNQDATTAGSTSVTATYGAAMPAITLPTKTGYIFGGYWGAPGGSGPQYYNADGSSTKTWDNTNETYTLYAKWTAITLSATISPSTINANTATAIQFSITTNAPLSSGYYFQITNWGGKNSGTAGGYNIDGDHQITSASPFTHALAAAKTNLDAGTYKIKLKITKDAVTQVESDLLTLTVSSSTYTVTVNAGTGGTVSPASISASPDSWSGNITATPNAGYQFVNWTSSGGGITINGNTANPTQIKATSTGGTLTANFSAATYRVTLDNQSATTAGTPYVDATYNTTTLTTTITKPTKTNYTFGGYYTATGGGGTQIIDANGNWLANKSGFTDSNKKSIITEDKILYAKWTETTYAVNVAVDDPSHAAGNIYCSAAGWVASKDGTAQIGNLTNVTITVPAGAAGYTYTGGSWTLTGGVTLVSGSVTSPSIIVKANAAGSAIFTYAEDLTTTWYLTGSFNDWSSTANKFTKKTGESTGKVAYTTVDLAANTTCTFGVNDGTTYYSNNNTTDAPTYYIKGTVEDWTFESNLGYGINCGMVSTLAGTYTFKIDFSGTNPKVSVYYPEIYAISGSFNSWSESNNLAFTGNDGSYEVTINGSSTNYEFKVLDNAVWYGHADKTFTATESNVTLASGGSNIKLKADVYPNGSYTFTYNKSTKKLGVTYPTSYVVNFGKRTGGSTVTAKINNTTAFTTGTKIASGTSVTFSQTAATGYTFEGWYDAASGGTKLSGNATYTTTITAAKTVYANYTEKSYNTTVSAGANGSVSPNGTVAIKQATGTSITATPNDGYSFIGWTISGGGITPTTSTTSPQTFKATSTGGTITANFAEKWNLKGDQWDSWGTYKPLTETGTNTFATTLELVKNTKYQFKVVNRTTNTYYGNTNGAGNKVFKRGDAAFTTVADGMNNNLEVTPDVSGTYTFTINTSGSTPVLTLTFQPAYKVNFGYGTGGSAVTASGSTDGAISTGDYVKAGDDVTFTQTPAEGYKLKGWYTAASGGSAVATMSKSDNVLNSIAATANVYAQYEGNTYSVSFNNNGGSGATPDPISVTYGAAYGTLPAGPTPPGADQFVGWSTTSEGAGTIVTAETLVATAANHTLYARFEHTYSVTVQYKCGTQTLRASTTVHASETAVAPEIIAPDILGYEFDEWTGDNATFADEHSATTTVHATAATAITANYTAVPMVYFKNNLAWDNVYVSFDNTWTIVDGKQVPSNKGKPYYKMTQLGTSDIFYCEIPSDYVANNYANWKWNIAFDNTNYGSTAETTHTGTWEKFYGGKFLGRGDFDPSATMYIPYDGDTETRNSGTYYRTGCWMKYNSTDPGYTIYANTYVSGAGGTAVAGTPVLLTADVAGGFEFKGKVNFPKANYSYGFMLHKEATKNTNDLWYTNTGAIHSTTTSLPWHFYTDGASENGQRCEIRTEAVGDYEFTVTFGTGRPVVNVTYPVGVGDWKLIYKDRATWSNGAHDANWHHDSRVIKAKESAEDIVSFFVAYGSSPSIELYKCTAINATTGAETWTKQSDVALGVSATGIYNYTVSQNASKEATAAFAGSYTGNYYIRTDASDGGWSNYKTSGANTMTYSEYSVTHGGDFGPYSHYFMRHVNSGSNIKFCIANDYSECISDTVVDDTYAHEWIEVEANIRFMWYYGTNKIGRAYVSGSTNVSDRFLVLEGDEHLYDADGNPLTGTHQISGLAEHEMKFIDDQNWVYETTVQANPLERVKLTAKFNNKIQYFYGAEGDRTEATTHQLIGGTGSDKYKMRVVYDFKTNRLVAAWLPSEAVKTEFDIDADVMIIRYHQGDAQQITFSDDGKLKDVQTVYGAMQFNKYRLNNQSEAAGHSDLNLSQYERDLFFISFPFDVKLNDVFGFGQYGKHWIIEYYDGWTRAQKGYWSDSPTNWKFVTKQMKDTFTLKANTGYVLALDLDELTMSSSVWDYGVENVYLYFPSTTTIDKIQATSATVDIDQTGYECTIHRNTPDGDRRVKDSYWHLLGVPSYANATNTTSGSWTGTVPNQNPDTWTSSAPYVYSWNGHDNKFGVISSTSTTFKPMQSYLVQYAKPTIEWASVNATPKAVAARRAQNQLRDCEFRLQLMQNDEELDHTFISLREDEEVTAEFDFSYDLSKMLYGAFTSACNVYTLIGEEQAAANCLPLTEQTTVVPVGLKVADDGEYTFSMPDGTNGVGVTLIDGVTGERTNLALTDYTVSLEKGTYDQRFVLEISPIEHTTTAIENSEKTDAPNNVCKKLIDGVLYIIKDGKVFDARGARLQ